MGDDSVALAVDGVLRLRSVDLSIHNMGNSLPTYARCPRVTTWGAPKRLDFLFFFRYFYFFCDFYMPLICILGISWRRFSRRRSTLFCDLFRWGKWCVSCSLGLVLSIFVVGGCMEFSGAIIEGLMWLCAWEPEVMWLLVVWEILH